MMWSHNETNFIVGDREMRELVVQSDQEQFGVHPETKEQIGTGIQQQRLILEQCSKSRQRLQNERFEIIFKDADVTDQELQACVIRVYRPLTTVSDDPDNEPVHKRYHFLISQMGGDTTPHDARR